MSKLALKDWLLRLGLKQAELAQLVGVSPRTVSLWATGEQALPGPVSGYLRLLEDASSSTREREFRRLDERTCRFDEGIYRVTYRGSVRGERETDTAIAVLRSGRIVGADRHGAVFRGSYDFNAEDKTNIVHLRVEIPPDGMLINGFDAGPKGAAVDLVGAFKRASPTAKAVLQVAGMPIEIELSFVEPLPN
jgi:transcriptional regulator with XRE-family HTH domain